MILAIKLATDNQPTGEVRRVRARRISLYFCIHKDPFHAPRRYVLAHIPTTASVVRDENPYVCEAVGRALAELPLDWSSDNREELRQQGRTLGANRTIDHIVQQIYGVAQRLREAKRNVNRYQYPNAD